MFFSVAHSQRCVSEKRLRRRTPVRFKQVREDIRQLGESVGLELDLAESFLERGHFEWRYVILVERVPLGIQLEPEGGTSWFPTLRGIIAWQPEHCWAAVDHGAIPFLMNRAACMAAGVQLADPSLQAGDLVWIRDEAHGKPLATGVALVSGDEMREISSGKAVSTPNWIGDEMWEIGA